MELFNVFAQLLVCLEPLVAGHAFIDRSSVVHFFRELIVMLLVIPSSLNLIFHLHLRLLLIPLQVLGTLWLLIGLQHLIILTVLRTSLVTIIHGIRLLLLLLMTSPTATALLYRSHLLIASQRFSLGFVSDLSATTRAHS